MTRRGSVFLAVLALVLGATPPTRAVDLRNVLNGYSLTTWGTNDGLPSSEVLAITQDIDGWLWLGTDTGLVRFDGTRFTAWPGCRASVRCGRSLTPREVEIVDLIRRGLRNREIAVVCGITEETVQSHVKSILLKLDVPDRTAAVNVALSRGIVHIL